MLADQSCISPIILDSLALAHGHLSYIISCYENMKSDRIFTHHFMRRPGHAIRRSMERNGYARIPDTILLCSGAIGD
jgi:hypothetical protein